jgi:hypothetical protein
MNRAWHRAAAFAAAMLLDCLCVTARAAPFAQNEMLHAAAASLEPGQYLWAPNAVGEGPLTLAVSIALQRIYVYRGGALIGVSAVSTGKPGHETPIGEFEILQKNRWHRSNLYSNAPMPFMQRLTWTGIALHAGFDPGYPASHGCIRMPAAFARTLFEMTALGGMVSVSHYPLQPPIYLTVDGLEWAMAGDDRVTGGFTRTVFARPMRLQYALAVFQYE